MASPGTSLLRIGACSLCISANMADECKLVERRVLDDDDAVEELEEALRRLKASLRSFPTLARCCSCNAPTVRDECVLIAAVTFTAGTVFRWRGLYIRKHRKRSSQRFLITRHADAFCEVLRLPLTLLALEVSRSSSLW